MRRWWIKHKYLRWERDTAANLGMIDPRLMVQFLNCPIPYSEERMRAQQGLLEAVIVGVQGGDAPLVFAAHVDQVKAALDEHHQPSED